MEIAITSAEGDAAPSSTHHEFQQLPRFQCAENFSLFPPNTNLQASIATRARLMAPRVRFLFRTTIKSKWDIFMSSGRRSCLYAYRAAPFSNKPVQLNRGERGTCCVALSLLCLITSGAIACEVGNNKKTSKMRLLSIYFAQMRFQKLCRFQSAVVNEI